MVVRSYLIVYFALFIITPFISDSILQAQLPVTLRTSPLIQFDSLEYRFPVTGVSDTLVRQVQCSISAEQMLSFQVDSVYAVSELGAFSVPTFTKATITTGFYTVSVRYTSKHNIQHKGTLVIIGRINESGRATARPFSAATSLLGESRLPSEATFSFTNNLRDVELFDSLRAYVKGHVPVPGGSSQGYNNARDTMFQILDVHLPDSTIRCIYTNVTAKAFGRAAAGAAGYNTEHVWPQSLGASSSLPPGYDLHNIAVAEENVNSARGNRQYDIVTTPGNCTSCGTAGSKLGTNSRGEAVFEPRNAVKGEVARSILYFQLRYGDDSASLPYNFPLYEATMRQWAAADPPNDSDRNRNNRVEMIQLRKNPFTTHPEFLERIFSLQNSRTPYPATVLINSPTRVELSRSKNIIARYILVNRGNSPAEILSVTSNGFTTIEALASRTIPPYGSLQFEAYPLATGSGSDTLRFIFANTTTLTVPVVYDGVLSETPTHLRTLPTLTFISGRQTTVDIFSASATGTAMRTTLPTSVDMLLSVPGSTFTGSTLATIAANTYRTSFQGQISSLTSFTTTAVFSVRSGNSLQSTSAQVLILPSFSVSGVITGTPVLGVNLQLHNNTYIFSTNAIAQGTYRFDNIPSGTYTLTPRLEGVTFIPSSATVNINNSNITGITFQAIANSVPLSSQRENFNSLGNAAIAQLPAEWKMSPSSSVSPFWSSVSNLTATSHQAVSGSPTTGGRYNWGNSSNPSDRALGPLVTSSYGSPNSIMTRIVNTYGSRIDSALVQFSFERYRVQSSTVRVEFFTSTNGTAWVAQPQGDIPISAFPTGTTTYTFFNPFSVVTTAGLTNLALPPGGQLFLRWNIIHQSNSNTQSIALDDFSFTPIISPPLPPQNFTSQQLSATSTRLQWQATSATVVIFATTASVQHDNLLQYFNTIRNGKIEIPRSMYNATTGSLQFSQAPFVNGSALRLVAVVTNATTQLTLTNLPANVPYSFVAFTVVTGNAISVSPSFINTASTSATVIDTLRIPLTSGWNLVSSYVSAATMQLTALVPSGSNIYLIKNNLGQNYLPSFGINQIGNWNIREGYQIFTTAADTLRFIGSNVGILPISLTTGWNIVSYLRNSNLPIETALQSILSNVLLVKNNTGQSYLPSFGINQIGNMLPTQGYQIYINSPSVLTYPSQIKAASNESIPMPEAKYFRSTLQTANSATLVCFAEVQEGEIAVFTKDNRLIGSNVLQNGKTAITLWGSDEITSAANEGEELFVKILHNNTLSDISLLGLTSLLSEQQFFTLHYRTGEVFQATMQVKNKPSSSQLTVFPNPANDILRIQINEQQGKTGYIILRDMFGRISLRTGSIFLAKNIYELTIHSLSNGIYSVELYTDSGEFCSTVIINR